MQRFSPRDDDELAVPRLIIERRLAARDVRIWHEGEAEGGAKPVRLCPGSSDVNLLRYGEGIIDFNTEIPDGALDLGMSQQQLHGT